MASKFEEGSSYGDHETISEENGEDVLTPQQQLIIAFEDNDLEKFCELLNCKDVDANYRYREKPYYGKSCIELCCKEKDREKFLVALLKIKKVRTTVNEIRKEPIHLAARAGNPKILHMLLLDKRTKLNVIDNDGRNALHHAAQKNNLGETDNDEVTNQYIACIKMLMERRDFNINHPNFKGFTPIHEAANFGGKKIVEAMLNFRGHDLNLDTAKGGGKTAREVIRNKYPDLLAPETCDDQHKLQHQLVAALLNNNLNEFRRLLFIVDSDGYSIVDPNHRCPTHKATCLEMAATDSGYKKFIKTLLEAGADPNTISPTTGETPLHIAVQMGNLEIVTTLLSGPKKIDVNVKNSSGKTSLQIAAELFQECSEEPSGMDDNSPINCDISDVSGKIKRYLEQYLQNNKLYPKTEDSGTISNLEETQQSTVSMHDIQTEYSLLFQFLYRNEQENFCEMYNEKKNRNINEYLDVNCTFLQYAVEKGMETVVQVLLESGVNPNSVARNNDVPPIIIAARSKNPEILKLLLKTPVLEINNLDSKGNTALHCAARNGDLVSVVDLLRHGADMKVRNVFNKLPLTFYTLEVLLDKCVEDHGHTNNEEYSLIFSFALLLTLMNYHKRADVSRNKKVIGICKKISIQNDNTLPHGNNFSSCSSLGNDSGVGDTKENSIEHLELRETEVLPLYDFNIANEKAKDISTNHKCRRRSIRQNSYDEKSWTSATENKLSGVRTTTCNAITCQNTDIGSFSASNVNKAVPGSSSKCEMQANHSSRETYKSHCESCVDLSQGPYYNRSNHCETDGSATRVSMSDVEMQPIKESQDAINAIEIEMKFLYNIMKERELKRILLHPVIRCFLHLKWNRIRKFYYLNLFIITVFVLTLNFYLLGNIENHSHTGNFTNVSDTRNNGTTMFRRNDMPIMAHVMRYDRFVVIFFLCLLFIREVMQLVMNLKHYLRNFENYLDWCLIIVTILVLFGISVEELTVIAILLSWLELMLVYGRHRKFSLNIQILKKVSKNYIQCLLPYTFVILAFAFSFYSLFHDSPKAHFFRNPIYALFKTVIMMNGEFEAGDFPEEKLFSYITIAIFIIFIFLTVMVLLNMLTGLAVSDTKCIIDKAQQLSLEAQVILIHEIEEIIVECYKFMDKISTCSIFSTVGNKAKKWLRSTLIFPNGCVEKRYRYIATPNKKGNHEVASDILGDTIRIISERGRKSEVEKLQETMEAIHADIKKRFEVSEIFTNEHREMLEKILSKLPTKGTKN